MGTYVHFSRALPPNSWWQTMVGWEVLSRPPAAEGRGRRPAFTGLATQPYSATEVDGCGNINSVGCLKTGPQYTSRLLSSREQTFHLRRKATQPCRLAS